MKYKIVVADVDRWKIMQKKWYWFSWRHVETGRKRLKQGVFEDEYEISFISYPSYEAALKAVEQMKKTY